MIFLKKHRILGSTAIHHTRTSEYNIHIVTKEVAIEELPYQPEWLLSGLCTDYSQSFNVSSLLAMKHNSQRQSYPFLAKSKKITVSEVHLNGTSASAEARLQITSNLCKIYW